MPTMKVKKDVKFSVRLKDVGPESKKKLVELGFCDESLTILSQVVTFNADSEGDFNRPMFAFTLMDHAERLMNEAVKCHYEIDGKEIIIKGGEE